MRKLKAITSAVVLVSSISSFSSFAQTNSGAVAPHVFVYKSKSQYRSLVSIQLSEDKKTVFSYPDPTDLKASSGYKAPVLLHKGYMLDKRGVSLNTAFIKMTTDTYSRLKKAPSPDQLFKLIVSNNPLTELYDCGVMDTTNSDEKHLNALIDKNQLKVKCKKIK